MGIFVVPEGLSAIFTRALERESEPFTVDGTRPGLELRSHKASVDDTLMPPLVEGVKTMELLVREALCRRRAINIATGKAIIQ